MPDRVRGLLSLSSSRISRAKMLVGAARAGYQAALGQVGEAKRLLGNVNAAADDSRQKMIDEIMSRSLTPVRMARLGLVDELVRDTIRQAEAALTSAQHHAQQKQSALQNANRHLAQVLKKEEKLQAAARILAQQGLLRAAVADETEVQE